MSRIRTKFPSHCARCSKPIPERSIVEWDAELRTVMHLHCAADLNRRPEYRALDAHGFPRRGRSFA